MMDNTFPIKKTLLTWSWSCCDFAALSSGVENQAISIGMTGPSFPDQSHRPMIHLPVMTFRKSGSSLMVWIKSLATEAWCFFCSSSRSCGINFAMAHHFMPRSCIKILATVVFGIPRSASSSHTVGHQFLLIVAHTHLMFSSVVFVAGFPEHGSLSTDSRPSLKHLCHTFICAALIALSPKSSWIIQIVSAEECSNLTQNLMQIHCSTCSVILNTLTTQYTC